MKKLKIHHWILIGVVAVFAFGILAISIFNLVTSSSLDSGIKDSNITGTQISIMANQISIMNFLLTFIGLAGALAGVGFTVFGYYQSMKFRDMVKEELNKKLDPIKEKINNNTKDIIDFSKELITLNDKSDHQKELTDDLYLDFFESKINSLILSGYQQENIQVPCNNIKQLNEMIKIHKDCLDHFVLFYQTRVNMVQFIIKTTSTRIASELDRHSQQKSLIEEFGSKKHLDDYLDKVTNEFIDRINQFKRAQKYRLFSTEEVVHLNSHFNF
ncbi:ATP synthase B chain precursor (ATP-synt_B) [Seinonella peptonophila]|uniref:ATP synthase B chain (ATP-synt_B) n=1 Tax=Seinonella peptonophila TaxID=112248 RepID=A0A1M4VC72_9BACL|nr:hypothetical protein [Seinonella peptonophila]SHE66551.1 ATP synthase B chain precursor (ATP-synt_B) [Seinonella peptonophila]